MKLQPNIGSDRSWVWKVAADYSEEPPTSETLAIRFANADSWLHSLLSVYPDSDASYFSSSGAVQESL
jgi:hypothetical protein